MSAQQFHLLIEQGSDYTLSIPVLDSGNQSVTVTGWTASGQVRADRFEATALHELDVTPAGSAVVLHIPADTSAAWSWRTGVYDVQIEDPDGAVTRLAEGVVVVRPEITRP